VLIVNADDWGLRAEVTDAIYECWRAGAVTSASAMVHMADSGRAFELAAEAELPLGLHLNLTAPFTASGVPAERRSRQQRAVEYFGGPRRRMLTFDPRVRGLLDSCIADQLDAFAESRGQPARHGDGHQHVQVCPTVLLAPSLGRLAGLRRAQSFPAGRRSVAKRAYRGALNLAVRRRFRSVRFLSLRDVHPALGGSGIDRLPELVRRTDLELMTHPAWGDEREVLLSSEWRHTLAGLSTGSHVDFL
jgi:chitin disaccharide deacetylase